MARRDRPSMNPHTLIFSHHLAVPHAKLSLDVAWRVGHLPTPVGHLPTPVGQKLQRKLKDKKIKKPYIKVVWG